MTLLITENEHKELDAILTAAYYQYKKELKVHSFSRISDKVLAEDIVQDAFIKAWNYLIKGGRIIMMRSFLYHVLNKLIIDEYRKHKTVSLDTLVENGFEPSTSESNHLIDVLDGRSAFSLIPHLPKKYQGVMYMKYAEDLSLEEIAGVTKQSKNTVAVQIHRGIEKFKNLYHNQLKKQNREAILKNRRAIRSFLYDGYERRHDRLLSYLYK
mgnify:FL=1